MKKQVAHLIIGLGKGGAETMLYQVLKYSTNADLCYKVISLGASHYYEEPIRKLGIPVVEVKLRKRPITSLFRVFKELKGTDTLCCWMYHANFIGYYLGKMARVERIVWGIHHSNLSKSFNKRMTLFLNKWCALISKRVDAIIYTGETARSVHQSIGYSCDRAIVLKNGCDCEEYKLNIDAKSEFCDELGISSKDTLLLSVSKNTPIKDIPSFIQAVAHVCRELPNIVAVVCGKGVEVSDKSLTILCRESGLQVGKNIFFLGLRDDVPHLLAACDLYVLHSAGEAFPVTLVEAMACGCLCVATDVGDVRKILNDDTFVCEPQNPQTLAKNIKNALALAPEQANVIRCKNRAIVERHHNIKEIVYQYEGLY